MGISQRYSDADVRVVQVALSTRDMPGTLRLYTEVLGFASGGGNAFWGEATRVQGLGNEARGLVFWLVGRQKFVQLEVFQYTNPGPALLPADHRPCDHGWVRFGVAVADFDRFSRSLEEHAIACLGPVVKSNGLRRLAFRDPYVGVVVEVLEDGEGVPGGRRVLDNSVDPALVYAAASVSDLTAAKDFYGGTLGLNVESRAQLHSQEHEAMWGLAQAKCDGFVLPLRDIFIEIVEYQSPAGRPRPANHNVVDQGIMNIALGSRSVPTIRELVSRIHRAGVVSTPPFGDDTFMATYINQPDRELELLALPESLDARFGFVPGPPFFGSAS